MDCLDLQPRGALPCHSILTQGSRPGGERVSAVARQMGVSRQTASKWLSRARRGEPLSDRPSRPRRLARSTHYSLSRPSGRLFCISPHSGNTMVSTPRGRWPTAPSRGRGGGLRGALVHAPPPARARRRDGRAGEDVRADRREEGASEARRRRSRHGRGPSPRAAGGGRAAPRSSTTAGAPAGGAWPACTSRSTTSCV